MTSTKSSRKVTVGTTKRSAAMIWLAWLVRKVRHVSDGGRGCRRRYLATVDSHRDSQLLKLPVNPRRAPERVRGRHLTNQRADIVWHCRAAGAMSALPRPEEAKTTTMPTQHGRWLHDVERRAPAVPSLREPRPQPPVCRGQAKMLTPRSVQHGELVSERDDLQV